MTTGKITIVAFAALVLLVAESREAQAGFGAGLSFGETGGVTGEYAISGRGGGRGLGQAVEATVGTGEDGYAHVVWKAYATNLLRRNSFSFVVFAGVGPFVAGGGGFLRGGSDGGGGGKKGKPGDKDKGKGGKGKDKGGKGGLGGSDRAFGARVPVGLALEFRKVPAHVFLELSAYAQSEDFGAIDTTTIAGFRWFF